MSNTSRTWKNYFDQGLSEFRKGAFQPALSCFTKAISHSSKPPFNLYDSRAAVLEKLGRFKDALQDSKKAIDIAPDHWQGYARSAAIFFQLDKYPAASKMSNMALERMPKDSKLDVRRATLVELQKKIRSAEAMRAPGTPIHKLPVELLSEVFILCSSDAPRLSVTLSHVCGHWRAVALSIPSLWRTLTLSKCRPTLKAKAWLQRSQGCVHELCLRSGLSQGMVGPMHVMVQSFDLGRQVLTELETLQWHRLRRCTLEDRTSYTFFSSLWESGRGPTLRGLQSLDLSESSETLWPQRRHWLLRDDADSSSEYDLELRSLTLRGAAPNWDIMLPHVCKLVSLELYDQPRATAGLRATLHRNLNLEKLVVQTKPLAPVLPLSNQVLIPAPPSFCCQYLRHLELVDVSDISEVFRQVDFPALTTLRLSGGFVGNIFNGLVGSGVPSLVNLQELTLRQFPFDTDVVIRTLLNAPQLQTLCLSHASTDIHGVLAVLIEPPSTNYSRYFPSQPSTSIPDLPITCPSLTRVDFTQCEALQTGPLIKLVSSRVRLAGIPSSEPADDVTISVVSDHNQSAEVVKLQSLIVDECPRVDAEHLPWFRKHVPTFSCRYMTKKQASWRR